MSDKTFKQIPVDNDSMEFKSGEILVAIMAFIKDIGFMIKEKNKEKTYRINIEMYEVEEN